ncbi:helicase-exonuclease AddAB subunit AddA [Paenibacillus sp. GCM10012307]|uniref:ATP-dependent helicase/nuclease subunit A n=1 Tax=Paenibacillus roseus TaxID=2798579 RepID=A0A934MSB4_9BACL|nr:helicase-exonuclease AddAB subunit AddA [Paenibacillus roseus]MBJ6363099.1 helicase-exonuclease AddAB subunit AddA [Paenibacillus roseus]
MEPVIKPEKPAGSTWTDEQWHAIVAQGRDILVAAAAGSGKTAVLVERIIRRISSDTDVDRLLVATFTKAAAAEMKERIRLALEKALDRDPGSEHLRRQLALLNRAAITTVHSFCMDVIRRYYPLIGLDPGFRIANTTEAELLRMEVLDELFEERYKQAKPDDPFIRLADDFGGERSDDPLYRLVLELYDFSRSHPWPDHWLEETAAQFRSAGPGELAQSVWVDSLTKDIRLQLEGACAMIRQAIRLANAPGGPDAYATVLADDLALAERLLRDVHELPWHSWQASFQLAQFGKLKPLRGDGYDKQLQEQVKALREQVKELISDTRGELFARQPEEFSAELLQLAPQMKELARLVSDFGSAYEQAKRKRSLLDFGDLEHYCLRILRDTASTPELTIPSAAALEYREQFDEILLDEYQDTNMVQEAIVALLAKPAPGNRFMVGDVKQSIYRFRLAEPNLFLHKYKTFTGLADGGLRIDLARNFRSRQEVVDGVNDVFRALMREKVAEMDYDRSAELICGASYPPSDSPGVASPYAVELTLLDRSGTAGPEVEETDDESLYGDETASRALHAREEAAELQTAQLEARWIALQIRGLMDGTAGTDRLDVYDGKHKRSRPMQWRDIVILLRATQQWAPVLIEELQALGIPAYAELSSGYFEATEIEVMLSLLRVIDNPYQDIPLAGALRSPLFGLDAEELALIRIQAGRGAYYDAVLQAVDNLLLPEPIREKLSLFIACLGKWREDARQGSLTNLLWNIYRETGYYDLVGGLPGGVQRQANLRALHDRVRQYEETSFRGLFRFLRFIDRMRESGGDLGTARALGEQEDVVRIMSIHKSKGLEFPVVFVAGLGKMFNLQDLNGSFLMHKELGFGPRVVDRELRVGYPSLPYLAIRKKMRMEMLAEELRVLYVALTRPKEKLYLVGTAADAQKQLDRLQAAAGESQLPDYSLAAARRYLDWLLPLALRGAADGELALQHFMTDIAEAPGLSGWRFSITPAALLAVEAAAAIDPWVDEERRAKREALSQGQPVGEVEPSSAAEDALASLSWQYPFEEAAALAAKTSVTEIKRLYSALEQQEDGYNFTNIPGAGGAPASEEAAQSSASFRLRRPRFMEQQTISGAERGTVNHLVMQHLPLDLELDETALEAEIAQLRKRDLLTERQQEAVDRTALLNFFGSDLAVRMRSASWVRREVPFTYREPARELNVAAAEDPILIQGVIDCLFEDERGLVLVDYKSDRIFKDRWEEAAERHRFQLGLYAKAIESILGRKVDECYIFFFDGARSIRLQF